MPGEKNNARNNVRRGRPRTAWIDNIKTWTGLSVEESIRMTEDRDKWRNYVHGVANPRIKDGEGIEQNRMALRHLGFLEFKISTAYEIQSGRMRHCAKYHCDCLNHCRESDF